MILEVFPSKIPSESLSFQFYKYKDKCDRVKWVVHNLELVYILFLKIKFVQWHCRMSESFHQKDLWVLLRRRNKIFAPETLIGEPQSKTLLCQRGSVAWQYKHIFYVWVFTQAQNQPYQLLHKTNGKYNVKKNWVVT